MPQEQIGVECLPLLSEHDLQALGVASAVDRARIAKSIYMQAQALRPFKEQQSREGDEGTVFLKGQWPMVLPDGDSDERMCP